MNMEGRCYNDRRGFACRLMIKVINEIVVENSTNHQELSHI